MRIKLLLGIVGAVFSYSLIILRSSLDGLTENVDLPIRDRNHLAIQMDSLQSNNGDSAPLITPQEANTGSAPIMTSFHASPPITMHILDEIRQTNRNIVKMLFNSLTKYLEDKDEIPVAVMKDHNYLMDAMPLNLIRDLHENVKLMVAGGFEKKCSDEYSSWRRKFLRQCLWEFEVFMSRKLNIAEGEEKMGIKIWTKHANIAVRILFPYERTLCDRIFSGFSSAANLSFMQVCSELMCNLLNFANDFVSRSPWLNFLPNILQVFNALHDLLPEIKLVFPGQHSASLRTEAFRTNQRLWKASRHLFMELESLIFHDMSEATSFRGICPITEEVMKYLSAVEEVVSPLHYGEVTGIVELLDSHLEAKFKDYTNLRRGFEQMAMEYKLKTIVKLKTIAGFYSLLQRTVPENHEHSERSIPELSGILQHDSYEESEKPNVA